MSSSNGPSQKAKTFQSPVEVLSQKAGQESSPAKKFQRPEFGLRNAATEVAKPQPEVKVFDATLHQREAENRSRIEELLTSIRAEVGAARAESSFLSNKLDRIEKAASQPAPKEIGIYHIEYYALLLEHARKVRTQLHAAMWAQAHSGRQKAKRGMMFAGSDKSSSQFETTT